MRELYAVATRADGEDRDGAEHADHLVAGIRCSLPRRGTAVRRLAPRTGIQGDGDDATDTAPDWKAQLRCSSLDFFSTMGMGVLNGRTFGDADRQTRRRVAVVSRSFARAYFGEMNPVGRQVRIKETPGSQTRFCPVGGDPLEIIGTVDDTQLPDPDTGHAAAVPTVYVPHSIVTPAFAQFLLRTSVPAAGVTRDVRRAVATADPDLTAGTRVLADEIRQDWIPWPRLLVSAAASFAGVVLVLVLVGVFGVLSYSIAQLTREIGIRMALGGSPWRMGREVLGRGLRWTVLGVAFGTAATLALHTFARSRVWGLGALDISLLAGVAGLVLVAGAVTSWFPARRAMRVDPVVALRAE